METSITKQAREQIAIELLDDLHAFQKLDKLVVNIISARLGVDAVELCRQNGITFNV